MAKPKKDPHEGYMKADDPRMLAVFVAMLDHSAKVAFSQDGECGWLWSEASRFGHLPDDVNFARVAAEGYVEDEVDEEAVRFAAPYVLTEKGRILALHAKANGLASTDEDVVRATTPKVATPNPTARGTTPDAVEALSHELEATLRRDALLRQNDPVATIAQAMSKASGLEPSQMMAAARLSYRTASMTKASERRASYERDLRMAAALTQPSREGRGVKSVPAMLAALRADGWMVGVHNDYRLAGRHHTFWLWTKGDRCMKGEGHSDAEALIQCLDQAGLT